MTENQFNNSVESCCQSDQLKLLSSDYVIVNVNDNFEPTPINLAKQHTSQPEIRQTDDSVSVGKLYAPLTWFAIGTFYIVLGIIIVVFIKRRKAIQKGLIISDASNVCPCKSCNFFANDSRLYCAVRPSDAMTPRAINCPDYCPKNSLKIKTFSIYRNNVLSKLRNLGNRILR